ncbi:MAG: amidohydrolase, partial [Gemmatimonadetes bacterium]|nr:amidohydrolase [Gemmatimonadota bacterium]NIQ56382.1 amidohydrolase [Gemmatimonadota bacterium]NIU76580.1 amidohydrolase [Gammaproteobacteria bacterium]NIX46024.1 amidohydrolase [Gemmatimonadota bacterium]NIY10347.1 amidohydrolase [Gemmatimonadota bacterium]
MTRATPVAGVVVATVAALTPVLASAQDVPHAFVGARIIPIEGAAIENGTLLVRAGTITRVGEADRVDVPDDAVVHDVAGKVIMPGLVDTHSHIGGGDGGDRSAPIHPSVRILDALDARDDGIQRAQAGGITTANIMPGSGHLMSGQTVYVKLRDAGTIDELVFCEDLTRDICGGMKMANGTNPRGDPPFPGTRAKAAALVREQYVKAQEYRRKVEA